MDDDEILEWWGRKLHRIGLCAIFFVALIILGIPFWKAAGIAFGALIVLYLRVPRPAIEFPMVYIAIFAAVYWTGVFPFDRWLQDFIKLVDQAMRTAI